MKLRTVLGVVIIFMIFFPSYAQTSLESKNQELIDHGISKMKQKEHASSLEMLVEAKALSEVKNWPNQNFLATNNIGANYFMLQEFGEALKFYLEAYEIAIESAEVSNIMTVLNNISILYFHERNMEKAYEYFHKAYEL